MDEYQMELINKLFRGQWERQRRAVEYLRNPDDPQKALRLEHNCAEALGFVNGMINVLLTLGYAIQYNTDGFPQVKYRDR